DQFDYYRRLVLQAQTEIADTYYLQGKFAEAADFFTRLLKQNSTELNIAVIRYKLLRCLSILGRHPQTVALAEEYVENHPDTAELPEVRFLLASSLKAMGRNRESMQQVLKLLAAQSEFATANPEIWNYWKQKAGNDIANDLYRDGDYLHALEIYLALAEISASPNWQLPVLYQIGLVYEHLNQRQKAIERYDVILGREKELAGPAGTPGLKALVDMARWRKEHLTWLDKAMVTAQALKLAPPPAATTNATLRPPL
ncbi:MAG TPA: tetratricopeptide repeat protein, partial [Methylomirabilota bacterium]|nr:tetratricopeptide repeat protein [Methylomirabilota bacterium]